MATGPIDGGTPEEFVRNLGECGLTGLTDLRANAGAAGGDMDF